MKPSLFSGLLVNLAVAAQLAFAKIAIDFGDYCDDSSITFSGTSVSASCRDITGNYVCSTLDVNTCIAYKGASLQPDPSGSGPHLSSQCINCSNTPQTSGVITNNPTLLHCQCNPGTGASQSNWPTAIIDLNTVVDNDNGYLSCNNIVGNSCSGNSNNGGLVISFGSGNGGTTSTFSPGKRAEPLRV